MTGVRASARIFRTGKQIDFASLAKSSCGLGANSLASVPPHTHEKRVTDRFSEGAKMYRTLGAAALAIAIAAPLQDSAAQDAVGGAIIGGAAGAILGGALDGGRG